MDELLFKTFCLIIGFISFLIVMSISLSLKSATNRKEKKKALKESAKAIMTLVNRVIDVVELAVSKKEQ